MNREIITLQLGHLTNSIGVHFWNHFHQENLQTQRYFTAKGLPRALIVDYRNAFGNLIEESSNSSMPKNLSSLQIIQRMVGESFWSKDLHSSIRFHPKSLIPLQGQWVQPDGEENSFDLYPTGEQMFQRMFDQFESSIHYLLESADSLESFRCLFDVNNGFSGLFTSIQDYLTDECPKRPIWSFGLANSSFSTLNFALALSHSIDENQMPTIPCLTSSNPFYQALAMQQSLFTSSIPLDLLADHLCPSKNFLLNLQWKIPFDLEQKTLYQYLESTEPFLLKDPIACHCFVRGIDQNALYNRSLYNWNISDPGELLETYFRDRFGSKMFVSSCSWKEKFDRSAMLTGLINDRASALELVNKLQKDLKKISWKTLSKRWEENDFDQEQFTETINRIDRLNELYQNPIDLI